ncbi:NAD-dependent deacylase [Paracrocinitomix mangrovi]|uniref:SIR2 family NAD-dependent protein deacylase n=1 Tax=Paracrocinitomix mangrovi TaxID=2862509 RepID=UPI001C8E9C84|nr:NAD-dependent deacylase [Paracrocinitomix mangrovi]UKN00885.1 NAD-dependent deacylase [Paracrocinitomix mangrovi]
MGNKKSKLVVLSGAGISAESGLGTFRDKGGLWDQYDINEVATPEAWEKNPELVLDFYNKRRELCIQAQPNQAHFALAELENHFDVHIVTQNIDDLHERAGSTNILHLHGEILKAQCSINPNDVRVLQNPIIKIGDLSNSGHQLRPHVVWFGESVPKMFEAEDIVRDADIFVVVGTSLNVYPAANLLYACKKNCQKFIVDINELTNVKFNNVKLFKGPASTKIPELVDHLLQLNG